MPTIWQSSYLQNLLEEAEREFSQLIHCIFFRFTLDITAGTSQYTLPEGLISIIRVTWLGDKVESTEHIDDLNNWIKPQNLANQGKPKFYLSHVYGYQQIKFHPVPNQTIGALTPIDHDDINLTTAIQNRVIVTGYRISQATQGAQYRIPDYWRRRYTKYRAMQRAYMQEGPGQNINAADFFGKKANLVLEKAQEINNKLYKPIQFKFGDGIYRKGMRPARPSLPSTGRWSF